MAKTRKLWVHGPSKTSTPKMPASVKTEVEQKANTLVETALKPKYIQPPPAPEAYQHNYIADIYTKWYRHYFYFCAKYNVPGPNALSPSFEAKFARLEYLGAARFNLSFMRHTGEWVELHTNLNLDECLTSVRDEEYFIP